MTRSSLPKNVLRVSLLAVAGAVLFSGCSPRPSKPEVVLYSSIDETYARRAADAFERETGITVKMVCDTEAAKSTGLLTRLLAEKANPVADVFWSGDVARAFALDKQGMLGAFDSEETSTLPSGMRLADGRIKGSAARARVMIVHRELAPANQPRPVSVRDLALPEYASRSCIANPLFGTTAVHAAQLYRVWGEDGARRFFDDFAKNGGRMVASNGEVRRRVGAGEFAFGLTDSDDLHVAWLDGKAVDGIIPSSTEQGGLLLPSAVVMMKGAPHPAAATRLASWLSGKQAEAMLAASEAAHWPQHKGVEPPEKFRGFSLPLPLSAAEWQEVNRIMERELNGSLASWVDSQR
jgi:iron(III) transport system substrate-binding protein